MAKKKQPQPPLVTPSPAKEPSEVASPVKKPSELASTSSNKKQPEPLQNPSSESGSESEESGSESEGEEDKTPKNPETDSAPVVANEISGSKSESVSDSESEPTHALAFNSIKSSFSFEVSLHQCTNKIRGLKKKYVKKMKNGGEASITKRHDLMCLARVKEIWGTTDVDVVDSTPVVKSNKNKKEGEEVNRVKNDDDSLMMVDDGDWFERSFIRGAITSFGGVMVDEEAVKAKWRLVPVTKKKGIEDKCKSLEAEEMKCFLLKAEILSEVSSALAKSD
ncbi:PREDICTED: probable transcription factor At4g00610 [Camelina sativa]|uniref:Probable transcription factor At4g00610 n=1 Tax=Camelina sativa TaxID=90675 RepID=A0ABM0V6S2_CAMSA|nr:PREDICTED: probable transcription factor At4g00610 [Camelina sativa]